MWRSEIIKSATTVTVEGLGQETNAVERPCTETLKTETEHELIYISGWQCGARQGVEASFRSVPIKQGVGDSIQSVLVKTRGCSFLLVVARRKPGSRCFHPVGAGKLIIILYTIKEKHFVVFTQIGFPHKSLCTNV